jgi:hypothetical protein
MKMALIIVVIDQNNIGSLVKVTAASGGLSDVPIRSAAQISAWKAPRTSFRFLDVLTRGEERIPMIEDRPATAPGLRVTADRLASDPLAVRSGDCAYDTGSLFLYNGAKSSAVVQMLFWGFKLHPSDDDYGEGRLMEPSDGRMVAGNLAWGIVRPPEPGAESFSLGSYKGRRGKLLLRE